MTPDWKAEPIDIWAAMREACRRTALWKGYQIKRMTGRGNSVVWELEKDATTYFAAIRTIRERKFEVKLNERKNLQDMDLVMVASLDAWDAPGYGYVQSFIFPAPEVRRRFNDAYAALSADGRDETNTPVLFVPLDKSSGPDYYSVGSGIAEEFPALATFRLEDLREEGEIVWHSSEGPVRLRG